MRVLRIDESSPHRQLIGVGGIGTGIFFDLAGNHTLGRNESRPGRLLDVRDYCKLHIVIHYVAKLLGARVSGSPFHVMPVGKVGDDAAGHQVVNEMGEAGIDTRLVDTTRGRPTLFSVCFQYPDGTGGNITTSNSAAAALCETDIDRVAELLKSGGRRAIALAVPEVALEMRHYFLQLAARAKTFRAASFVPAEIAPAKQAGMFQLLDLVSLNEEEAQELIGCSFSSVAPEVFVGKCQEFLRSSCPNLRMVVSAGKSGAYGVTADLYNYCPAPKVEVASTAGAGDSLLGGIIAAVASGIPFLRGESTKESVTSQSVETALELGVLLASYKCLSPHTIHPSACVETLDAFARDLGKSFSNQVRELLMDTIPT
ncbi:MAG TPA: carbohydrate kinase family protein [Terriglobales bacterium]|jgi:sugar/nucleoside kinase (ribokinase family)